MNAATPPEADPANSKPLADQQPQADDPLTSTGLRDLLARTAAAIQDANAAGVPF